MNDTDKDLLAAIREYVRLERAGIRIDSDDMVRRWKRICTLAKRRAKS